MGEAFLGSHHGFCSWAASGCHLGIIWVSSGGHLGIIWGSYGKHSYLYQLEIRLECKFSKTH
jgi:hypothetical protein